MSLPILGQPQLAPFHGPPFLAKGFRPFFLFAGIFAALYMPLWLVVWAGVGPAVSYFDPSSWHAHELIFGFTIAVVAGFLLTAVANWTGRETLTGKPLLALASLWVLGRLAFIVPSIPPPIVAVLDLAFIPALMFAIGRPLIATRNKRNYVMLAVLAVLWSANLFMHLDAFGRTLLERRQAALLAVDVLVFLVAFVGTRIIPTFTRNATKLASIRNVPSLDRLALIAVGALVVSDLGWPESIVTGVCAASAAALLVARSLTWGSRAALRVPLLSVLHVGQLFLVIGFVLRALADFGLAIPHPAATHALTVGALAVTIIGMMARVSLGHTGRPLVASTATRVAFALIATAALVRSFGALLDATHDASVHLAGTFWSVGFAMFVFGFARILVTPRPDGKSG